MEKKFQVISDSSCDLPEDILKEKDIPLVPFYVTFDGEEYLKERVEVDIRDFFQRMVDNPKVFPKSSMPGVEDFKEAFEVYAKIGLPVLCICISTKFSGSFTAARNAKELILESYPESEIVVIDSRINTVLQGLLTLEAAKLRDSGYTLSESVEILNSIKETGRIFFTVGNFAYLKSGGRIGKVAKAAGDILGIRPVITLKEGEIFASGVGRSRRKTVEKSIALLREYVREVGATPETFCIDIGFGYDFEEALKFRREIVEELKTVGFETGIKDIPIFQIGAAIGVHTGPHPLGVSIIKRAIEL